jgi:hypothetical protein
MAGNDTEYQHAPESSGKKKSGDALWTLQQHGRFIECTLRFGRDRGVEVQIRRDGQLCAIREFDGLEQAVAHGNALAHDLGVNGWQAAPAKPSAACAGPVT